MPDDKDKVEARRVRNFLCSMAIGHSTVTAEVLKEIYLAGSDVICGGHLREIKSRHLGAGVYKVWTAKWVEEKP